MNVNLFIRSQSGERASVGTGDPVDFGQSLSTYGIEGESPEITLQWFNDENGVAGVEAIYEDFAPDAS